MSRFLLFSALFLACLHLVLADPKPARKLKQFKDGEIHPVKNVVLKTVGKGGEPRKKFLPTQGPHSNHTMTGKPPKRAAASASPQCTNVCKCIRTGSTMSMYTNQLRMSAGCDGCPLNGQQCYSANSVCKITSGSRGTCTCKGGSIQAGASCVACPSGFYSSTAGTCVACAPNAISTGTGCTTCPAPKVRSPTNTCV